MSNSAIKTPVKAEWDTAKVRTEVLKSVSAVYASLETILEKDEKSAHEAAKAILINKGYYADLKIDSPKALAHAIAEYTTNVLGIKVATVDDGSKYSLVFEGGAFVNKLASIQKLSTEASEKLVKAYKNGLADLGGYYGYVTEVSSVEPDFIVSFSK